MNNDNTLYINDCDNPSLKEKEKEKENQIKVSEEDNKFENLKLDCKISLFLHHPKFIELFENNEELYNVIWYIIEFFSIFKHLDFESYYNFAKKVKKNPESIYNFYHEEFKNHFSTQNPDPYEVYDYLITCFQKEWFFYHCFNGAFKESIQNHWLSPTIRNNDKNEIEKIIEIWEKFNLWQNNPLDPRKSLFPSYFGDLWNVSISSTPYLIGHYLKDIPEWYWVFLTRLFSSMKFRESFYEKESYYTIQDEIYSKLSELIPDTDDKIFMLQFIEKNWILLTSEPNKIALIKAECINWDEVYNYYVQNKNELVEGNSIKFLIELLTSRKPDYFKISSWISPENLLIIEVPFLKNNSNY